MQLRSGCPPSGQPRPALGSVFSDEVSFVAALNYWIRRGRRTGTHGHSAAIGSISFACRGSRILPSISWLIFMPAARGRTRRGGVGSKTCAASRAFSLTGLIHTQLYRGRSLRSAMQWRRVVGTDPGRGFRPTAELLFGHRRLAIIDLRAEASQPMVASECGLTIVFNGEIYNYKALREELAAKGHRFRSTSDTEVLLYLYAEYGMDMCASLRGMYAFAIYDERDGSMFLARDPFRIKPLYYADDGRTFRFASQVKALLAGGSRSTPAGTGGPRGVLPLGICAGALSAVRGIRALEPGSALRSIAEVTGRREFSVRSPKSFVPRGRSRCAPRIPPRGSNSLREFLLDSIRHHMVADVPIAVFLSAGIDLAVHRGSGQTGRPCRSAYSDSRVRGI